MSILPPPLPLPFPTTHSFSFSLDIHASTHLSLISFLLPIVSLLLLCLGPLPLVKRWTRLRKERTWGPLTSRVTQPATSQEGPGLYNPGGANAQAGEPGLAPADLAGGPELTARPVPEADGVATSQAPPSSQSRSPRG